MRKFLAIVSLAVLLLPAAAHAEGKAYQLKNPAGAEVGRVDVDWDAEDVEMSVEVHMKGCKAGQAYQVLALVGKKWVDLGTAKGAPDGSLTLNATTTPDDPDETKIVLPANTKVADFHGIKVMSGKTLVAEGKDN